MAAAGFQINHPFIFFIPIMATFTVISFLVSRRKKRNLPPWEWPKFASIALLVALCFLIMFTNFNR